MLAPNAVMEASASRAWELHQRIVKLKRLTTLSSILLGGDLAEMKDGKLYRELDHPTWESYLASPEVALHPRAAERLTRIWHVWVGQLGYEPKELEDAGISKLEIAARVVVGEPGGAAEWLEKAKALARNDLLLEVAEAKGRPVPAEARRWRVWVGKPKAPMGGLCLTRAADEDGAEAEAVLEGPVFAGWFFGEPDGLGWKAVAGGWLCQACSYKTGRLPR